MTQAQENSYDKAVNALNDAKIRGLQALPYIKKAAESVLYQAIWLLGLVLCARQLHSNQNSAGEASGQLKFWDILPDKSKIILGLYGVLKIWYGNNNNYVQASNVPLISGSEQSTTRSTSNKQSSKMLKGGIMILTSGLHQYAKDPQDGKKIVEQAGKVLKDCFLGLYCLAKAGYYLIDYYGVSESEISEEIQSDQPMKLNGEEPSLPTSE